LGLLALIAEHRLARLVDSADGMLYLDEAGRLIARGAAGEVLPIMPYGPPLAEAARRMNAPLPIDQCSRDLLRDRLRSITAASSRPSPAGPARVAASGLFHAYNGVPALQGAEIEIRPGEIVAVLGRNGSGKSTLLRCLVGLEKPSRGSIWLDGRQIERMPVAERAGDIAFVPQWPSTMLFAETVRHELALTLRYRGLAGAPPHDAEALLAALGLEDAAGRYPRDLAAGEQQRAAIGAMLVAGPRVLLLDEPTLGLDALAQERIGSLLEAERRKGAAIAIATHDVEFAATHADTAVVLDRGTVVASGPTAETLFGQPSLRTSIQRLTGRPRPASVAEVPSALNDPKG
jgi:energy-coupling factor transport system ATP-binding protein